MSLKNDYRRAAGLGFEIALATFLGAFIGYQIDLRLKSLPNGMVVGIILGSIAGMWNAVRLALKTK